MKSGHYFAEQSPAEIESRRLGLLETLRDAPTTRRMEHLGVGPGWRCLEVGAGRGSIALWLARKAGPSGHVVAADIDTRFLAGIESENLEVRRYDLRDEDLAPHAYDLVHCRALLAHLPRPEQALLRLARAVRAGGWLFVEECDFRSFGAVDASYPGAREFDLATRSIWDASEARGVMRSYLGRQLPGMVRKLGFQDFGCEGAVEIGRGGEHALARFYSLRTWIPAVTRQLIASGTCSDAQIAHLRRMYDDPGFEFLGPTFFSAWARRP